MFLSRLKENNPALLKYAFETAKKGEILPDTYILDLDTIIQNAKIMKEEADKYNRAGFGDTHSPVCGDNRRRAGRGADRYGEPCAVLHSLLG